MKTKREQYGLLLIAILGVLAVSSLFFLSSVPQDVGYHNFSDESRYLLIPNALNVLSNLPFIIVGLYGCVTLLKQRENSIGIVKSNTLAYVVLYSGVALVGIGSGYYHLWPSNNSLVWDGCQ